MPLIIGLGTGRSGTTSLARLLDGCVGARVTHEECEAAMRWKATKRQRTEALCWLGTEHEPRVGGDVGYYWLRYIPDVLEHMQDVRVVAIRRDAEEVAESYVRYVRRHGGEQFMRYPAYVQRRLGEESASQRAFLRYALRYQERVDELAATDERVSVVTMGALNTRRGQEAIFEAAGVPEERRSYGAHHCNATEK